MKYQIIDMPNTPAIQFWVYSAIQKIPLVEYLSSFWCPKNGYQQIWGGIFESTFDHFDRTCHQIHLGEPDRSRTEFLQFKLQIFSRKQ